MNCTLKVAVVAFLLIAAAPLLAATLPTTSASQPDVQSAINAAQTGDTVLLPAGASANWSTRVTIPNTKGITLDGNGAVINGQIEVSQNAQKTTRITRFSFTQTDAVNLGGLKSSAPFRVDHNTFTVTTGGVVLLNCSGNAPGLIDHNSFNAPTNSEMIHNFGMGASEASGWSDDIVPGSADAVYIEDNTFTNNDPTFGTANPAYFWGNSAVQSYYGSRTVFRHNFLTMSHVDQHGTPGMIGARWWEIYENTFSTNVPNASQCCFVTVRGGSGVIFNNHHTGANLNGNSIDLYEEDSGYPALYQIGRGKNQASDPAYVWGNDAFFSVGSQTPAMVQSSRDYYPSAKPGYTPYTYPHPLASSSSSTDIIPPERRIDWSNAGVPGGIPARATVHATIDAATYGTGITDAAPAIQAALNACPVGQVVKIPAGTYRLNSELNITKGIVLRGAGPNVTRLKTYANWHGIQMGDWPVALVTTNVSGSPAKGATSVTVASVSSPALAVGDFIVIDQVNDGVEVVNVDDYSRDNGTRCLSQMTRITAINGLTLTIDPPLYHAYASAQTPQVWKLHSAASMTVNAGLEDLCIERVSPTGTEGYNNIKIIGCAYSWVKNVESKLAQFRHVDFDRSFRNTVSGCFFNDGMHHGTGGFAYGAVCGNRATANLIEDNIFYHLRHSMVIKEGAAGNVFGYNYSVASYQGENWLAADLNAHGAHSHMNLFEGNVCAKIYADFTHGSSSYNTFFRNNVIRDSSALLVTNSLRAVALEKSQYYYNLLGNVLGKPNQTWTAYEDNGTRTGAERYAYNFGYPSDGATSSTDPQAKATVLRHGNFDYATQTTKWDPNISNQTLPASLYRTTKPAFFGNVAWPPIGPGLTPLVSKIPAQLRYEGGGAPKRKRDFDGDGKEDLLLRHPSNGSVNLWLMR